MRLEWHNLPAADGQLAEIWEKALREPEALTRQEVLRFLWFMSGYFHILEGFWLQYQRRLIDEATWLPLQSALRGLLSNPLVLAWWNEENLPLSRGFRAFVDDIRESETDGAWTYTSGEDLHARIRQKAVTP